MQLSQILSILLAAILTIFAVTLATGFKRSGRKALSARINLIAPPSALAPGAAADLAFVRFPVGKLHEREMREVLAVCKTLRIPTPLAPSALMAARGAGAMGAAALGYLMAHSAFHGGLAIGVQLVLAGAAAIAGWSAPMLLAHHAADERAAAVARGLPEALELLVVCVEAGLALENGIERITEEIRPSDPLLADELALTAADLKVLPTLDEGLANLAARVDLPNIHSVVTIISQSLRYGTPLVQALRSAAAEMRNEDLIALEERGNRLPTLLTLPMMLFILPTIFLIVGGPAALKLFDVFGK